MLALVVCSAPFIRIFTRELEKRGFRGWTLVPKVLGAGGKSDPQMDDDVWPGYSGLLLIHFPPEREKEARELLKEFDKKIGPFKAFLLKEVEEL